MGMKHIAVVMGGWSPEREISLISGADCAAALREAGYQVSIIDAGRDLVAQLQASAPDVIFNALHGVGGEDGVVQGVFELLEIPYTHSGVLASALAMDKVQAKKIFAAAGLNVAADITVMPGALTDHPMTPPYVVKPINQGSSVGVEIVKTDDAPLSSSLTQGTDAVMVEAYVPGRELSCSVRGGTASVVTEIFAKSDFYDYQAKYDEGGSEHVVPAEIDPSLKQEIQRQSLIAHNVLGCRGITRTDFRFDDRPDGMGLVVLETNTQPGMTPVSLVPEMAAHEGISYAELVSWMVEDASCQR